MCHVNHKVLLNTESHCQSTFWTTPQTTQEKLSVRFWSSFITTPAVRETWSYIILYSIWCGHLEKSWHWYPSTVNSWVLLTLIFCLLCMSIISTLVLGSESHVHCRTPTNQQLIGRPSFEKINGPIRYFHIIMWLGLQKRTISCILAYFKEEYLRIAMHNQNRTWCFMEQYHGNEVLGLHQQGVTG